MTISRLTRMALLIAASASLSTLAALTAQAQERPPGGHGDGFVRSVTARGACSTLVAPDRGRLTIWAQRTQPAAAKAVTDATNALAALHAKLEALHLADASFETNGVQIDKQQIDGPKGPTGFRYEARAALQLESSDLAGLGRAMDAVAGADEIAPLSIYVSEDRRQKAIDACLPKATAEARRHAEALLAGLGDKLGPVLRIDGFDARGGEAPASDLFGGGSRPVMMARMAEVAPKAEVSASDRNIEVSTTVRFGIAGTAP